VRDAAAAIRQINLERSQSGIPAGIVQNRAWSERCLAHARWMRRNHSVEHVEKPGTPMYSAAGAWAGVRSVLSGGWAWTTRRNPWDTAPMHLAQLLAPQLRQMGVGIYRGYDCATTLPGYKGFRAREDMVYAYPSGKRPVRWREHANEVPFTPQSYVGIDASQITGPYLYVFADGPWLASGDLPTIHSATLTGPEGPVEVRFIDSSSPEVGPYLPSGCGIVIPVKPLERNALYTASVTLANHRWLITRTWTFVTRRR